MNENQNNLDENKIYKIHVMPPSITDEDISALFNGILNVVKKKFELEKNAETIILHLNMDKTLRELKEKNAEISRLKNEIIYLQSQLKEQNDIK